MGVERREVIRQGNDEKEREYEYTHKKNVCTPSIHSNIQTGRAVRHTKIK